MSPEPNPYPIKPKLISGKRDILGAAETGSGKTLAFGLPILAGILKIKEKEDQQIASQKDHTSSDSEESDFEMEMDDNGRDMNKMLKSCRTNNKNQR